VCVCVLVIIRQIEDNSPRFLNIKANISHTVHSDQSFYTHTHRVYSHRVFTTALEQVVSSLSSKQQE